MQTYLLSAAGVIFLSVIVSLLIPEGKLNKTITFVMWLVCIFVLIQPLVKLFSVPTSATEANSDLFDTEFVCREYSKHQSAQLAELLNEKFAVEADCTVEIAYDGGNFKPDGVEVVLKEKDFNLIGTIYEYLKELGYINITVYAETT